MLEYLSNGSHLRARDGVEQTSEPTSKSVESGNILVKLPGDDGKTVKSSPGLAMFNIVQPCEGGLVKMRGPVELSKKSTLIFWGPGVCKSWSKDMVLRCVKNCWFRPHPQHS